MLVEVVTVSLRQFLINSVELHTCTLNIRMSGIAHLNNHPELYVESIYSNSWANYVQQMSNPGTWCDNIIIQAVALTNIRTHSLIYDYY